jgi:hypothetical protein
LGIQKDENLVDFGTASSPVHISKGVLQGLGYGAVHVHYGDVREFEEYLVDMYYPEVVRRVLEMSNTSAGIA